MLVGIQNEQRKGGCKHFSKTVSFLLPVKKLYLVQVAAENVAKLPQYLFCMFRRCFGTLLSSLITQDACGIVQIIKEIVTH